MQEVLLDWMLGVNERRGGREVRNGEDPGGSSGVRAEAGREGRTDHNPQTWKSRDVGDVVVGTV